MIMGYNEQLWNQRHLADSHKIFILFLEKCLEVQKLKSINDGYDPALRLV